MSVNPNALSASPVSARQTPVIVCGINAATSEEELQWLLDAGAREFFCGWGPPEWFAALGAELPPNRRYRIEGQILDVDRLGGFSEQIAARGGRLVVAMNDHYYAPSLRPMLMQIVETGLGFGATGFIVASVDLLELLGGQLDDGVELIASCEAGCYNNHTAMELIERGATRIIFAREMMLREMSAIISSVGPRAVEYEAFVAREHCCYSSAVCFATHGYDTTAHFCSLYDRRDLHHLPSGESETLPGITAGWGADPQFLSAVYTLHRCGLCSIDDLLSIGVRYLKVPGRSNSAFPAIRLLGHLLKEGTDRSPEACRTLVASDEFCESGNFCYYEPGLRAEPASRFDPVFERGDEAPAAAVGPAARSAAPELGLYVSAHTGPEGWPASLAGHGVGRALEDAVFATTWERDVATQAALTLPVAGVPHDAPIRRIYLGLELCALRLRPVRRVVDEIGEWRAAGFEVSLVTPVAYQDAWCEVRRLVDEVLAAHPEVELVLNDLGLLRYAARHWPGSFAVGRIFNRMRRDQFAGVGRELGLLPSASGCSPDATGLEEASDREAVRRAQSAGFGYPYLRDPTYRSLLQEARVTRIGIDVLPTALSAPLPEPFDHTLYLPWTYSASGRSCATAVAVEGARQSFPVRSCRRPCTEHLITPAYSWSPRRVVHRGAAVFMDCTADLPSFVESLSAPPARVVFQPLVPV